MLALGLLAANWKNSMPPVGEILPAPPLPLVLLPGRGVVVGERRGRPCVLAAKSCVTTVGPPCSRVEGSAATSDSDFEEADKVSNEEQTEVGTCTVLRPRLGQLMGERLHSTGSSPLARGDRSASGSAPSQDFEGDTLLTEVFGELSMLPTDRGGALRNRTGRAGGGGNAEGSGNATAATMAAWAAAVRAIVPHADDTDDTSHNGGEIAPTVDGDAPRSRSHWNCTQPCGLDEDRFGVVPAGDPELGSTRGKPHSSAASAGDTVR